MPQEGQQIKFVFITKSQFDELEHKDENSIYCVVPDESSELIG